MTVARPRTLDEALDALAELPDADILAGGTDFMVEVNFGHRRPDAVVALRRVDELRGWAVRDHGLTLGAGITYRAMQDGALAAELPALAAAARTVGSPAIRNAGTLGGNVATASPAGDTLPVLVALDAEVELAGPAGGRRLPVAEFITGPKRTGRRPGEIIRAVHVPRTEGPQAFLKVGTRNAMVIAISALALIVDVPRRRVRVGLGSVGPVPLRARGAEELAAGGIDWDRLTADDDVVDSFGSLAAEAARPITDHRATADYRRHTIAVLARRALRRALADPRAVSA